MSLYDKMRKAANYNTERKNKMKEVIAKEQLEQLIEKRIKTVFIGALDRFEKKFGFLWGKDQERLTSEEKKMLYLWKQVRTDILDHGHDQIKLLIQKELIEYHVQLDRKQINTYEFLKSVKKVGENDGESQ